MNGKMNMKSGRGITKKILTKGQKLDFKRIKYLTEQDDAICCFCQSA